MEEAKDSIPKDIMNEIIWAIKCDRDTFKSVGRKDYMGHNRSLMLIGEILKKSGLGEEWDGK